MQISPLNADGTTQSKTLNKGDIKVKEDEQEKTILLSHISLRTIIKFSANITKVSNGGLF